ncbi:MAG: hypothetical protein KC708_19145 [Anaerolineae bacterium]|nr:hypothetical protein [Anaerolineae bacterium]
MTARRIFSIFLLAMFAALAMPISAQTSAEETLVLGAREDDETDKITIVLISLPSGEEKDIAIVHYDNRPEFDVHWSPDGQFVYILGQDATNAEFLKIYDVASGELRLVSNAIDYWDCYNPVLWSPDSQLVYLTGQRRNDDHELNIYDPEQATSNLLASFDQETYSDENSIQGPYWYRGDILVGIHNDTESRYSAFAISPEGEASPISKIPEEYTSYSSARRDQDILWSPDRRYVVIEESGYVLRDTITWQPILTLPSGFVQWTSSGHLINTYSNQNDNPNTVSITIYRPDTWTSITLEDVTPDSWRSFGNYPDTPNNYYFVYRQIPGEGTTNEQPHIAAWDLLAEKWVYQSDFSVYRMKPWHSDRYLGYTINRSTDIPSGYYVLDTETWETQKLVAFSEFIETRYEYWSSDNHFLFMRGMGYDTFLNNPLYVIDTETLEVQQLGSRYEQMDPRWRWFDWSNTERYAMASVYTETYIFDTHTQRQSAYPYSPQWDMAFSPNDRYLAFLDSDTSYIVSLDSHETYAFDVDYFIGWQYGNHQQLLVCGEG